MLQNSNRQIFEQLSSLDVAKVLEPRVTALGSTVHKRFALEDCAI